MCGIISFQSSQPMAARRLESATLSLRKRGPDEQNVWMHPQGLAGLGHCRLAIVDPTGGRQPVCNETGTVRAVVNGEFYDFQEQRRWLEGRGHQLSSHSDSELVCHLYEEYGLGFVEHLRGEFSLLLYDQDQQRLVAVRDPFGIKPLVYAQIEGEWWFASKARALFAAGLPACLSEESFWQAASTQYPLPEQTFFEGVRQVAPGSLVVCQKGQLNRRRYWNPQPMQETDTQPGRPEEFRERLEQAVCERLPSGWPVALQLSGGIDSGAVVALAAQHRNDLTAFTVSYPGTRHDELAQAHLLADMHGVPLEPVPVTPKSLLEALPKAVACTEGLAINAHLAAKYLLAERVRAAGFKVVLTGEGADEVLLGYPHFRQDLAGSQDERRRIADNNPIATGIMVTHSPGLSLHKLQARLGHVPAFLEAKAALGLKIHQCLRSDFLAEYAHRDAFLEMLGDQDWRGLSPIEQSSRLWNQSALANYILHTLGDGCEMAHSLEGRLPFLDGGLARWLAPLPLHWKIRQGREKYLLKQACRSILPASLVERQKQPFMAPPLLAQGHLQKRLRQRAADSHPFVDSDRLGRVLDRLDQLPEAQQQEWDPALTWLLTSYHLHESIQP